MPQSHGFVSATVVSGGSGGNPVANDAINYRFPAYMEGPVYLSIDALTNEVHVRVNSFGLSDTPTNEATGEATATSHDLTLAADIADTVDLTNGGEIPVLSVSLFVPTGTTGDLANTQLKARNTEVA